MLHRYGLFTIASFSGFQKSISMTRTLKIVFFVLFSLGCNVGMRAEICSNVPECGSSIVTSSATSSFDWEPVMQAIIQVESEGNARAQCGNSCGAMQITPILVAECNDILRKRKSKKKFTLRDRFSIEKSKEMFLLIQSYFNPLNDIEKAIRSWNGGMNYSVKRTQRYFERVMGHLK